MSQRRFLVILLVICLAIAYVYLISDYLKQSRQQVSLSAQANSLLQTLELIPGPSPDLAQRLAQAEQASLRARESVAADDVNVNTVVDTIFKIADESNLKLTPLSTDPWLERVITENSYHILRMSLKIEGSLADLLTFVERLEDRSAFPYLAVETLSINQLEGQAGIASGTTDLSADITLAIFSLVEEKD